MPREWSHVFQCSVGLLHVFLWLVGCMFRLDNALSGCTCAWYRLNAYKPCFGRISFTRFIELVAFFPREVAIVSVSSFLVGLVGYIRSGVILTWCLLHMF